METSADQQTIPEPKPRKPFIAFLLSLFLPGLGQVYNGQPKKALLFFSLLILNPFVFGLTRGSTYFYGLLMVVLIEASIRIFVLIDTVRYAKRQKEYIPRSYNKWYKYLFIAFLMLAVFLFIDTSSLLGARTFSISSISNLPTLQAGDRVVCDLRIYDNKQPGYGDIIIFKREDGFFYPCRIVGLPNDRLEIQDNFVSINGKQSKSTFIKDTVSGQSPVMEYEEELPNGHKHLIYKFKIPFDSTKASMKDILVPAHSYFVMGDNRDCSADSRYIGPISIDDIAGQLIFSYWGKTTRRINIDFRDK